MVCPAFCLQTMLQLNVEIQGSYQTEESNFLLECSKTVCNSNQLLHLHKLQTKDHLYVAEI